MWKWPRLRKLTEPKPLWVHERYPSTDEQWRDECLTQLRRLQSKIWEIEKRLDRIEGIR